MKFTGKLQNVSKDWQTGQFQITFTVNEPSAINQVDKIKDLDKLKISADKYSEDRSSRANRLLWDCLGEIGKAMNPPVDKWDVYLLMLKRYGKYTYHKRERWA